MKTKIPHQITTIAIFTAFLIMNLAIHLNGSGDDNTLFFLPLHNEFSNNYISFLSFRYNNWSSRLIIEFFTLLSVNHTIIWRIINTIAFTALAIAPVYLFNLTKQINKNLIISTCLILFIPKSMFNETGWIATTTNYLWSLAAILLFLLIIIKNNFTKKIDSLYYFISLLLLLYASNLEQLCVVTVILIPLLMYYFVKTKNNRKLFLLIPPLFIVFINLLLILLSPGNKVRFNSEIMRWYPDFNNLSILRKIELGFSSTFKNLYLDNQLLFIILSIILLIYAIQYKNKINIITATFPLIVISIFGLFKNILSSNLPIIDYILNSFNSYGTTFQLDSPKTWLADILLISVSLCLLQTLYTIFCDNSKLLRTIFLIITLSVTTRMIMGFSPTIWASGSRTSLFLYYSLSIISLLIIKRIKNNNIYFLVSLAFICYLNFLL